MTNLSGLATEMEEERQEEGNRSPNGGNSHNDSNDSDDFFSNLLELAADDDVEALKGPVSRDPSAVDGPGRWLCRRRGSSRAALLERTPIMVAATYGSLDALSFLLSLSADPNRASSSDGSTALHCAASGGADGALQAARLLLSAGADPNLLDHDGLRPADVIPSSLPRSPSSRLALEEILGGLRVSTSSSSSSSPPLSGDGSVSGSPSSDSTSSPGVLTSTAAKKEYPVDPSLPDIKNSIYSTDEFRMYSFKVRPCSRAYSHDWTECPFVHPGENARRRDPRKFHYSCVPCPDFRKGSCRRGDLCEYAHGVFECWLHPAQYRTRLCKDGTTCTRRVCFFAHTQEELRPLFVSTGSAVPSPRNVDIVGPPTPGSPSSPFTPPMSPNGNVLLHHHHAMMQAQLPQPAVPALHLPGSSLSRLRTSLNARDLPVDELSMLDLETQQQQQQLMGGGSGGGGGCGGDYSCFSPRLGMNVSSRCKAVTPANLEELFVPEVLSPRFAHEPPAVYSPTHKLQHHLQQQQGKMLSPIKTTGGLFSPAVTFVPASAASPVGGMSPRGVDPTASPMGGRLAALAQREKHLQLQQMRSLSSRELGGGGSGGGQGSPAAAGGSSPWAAAATRWGSPTGKVEWAVNGEELGRMRRSGSFGELVGVDEPDVSWVHSLVKESPPEGKERADAEQTVLAAWLEQMQIDQAAAS